MKYKIFLMALITFMSKSLFAQTTENPFYTNGKIYVVVTIMSIIFVGIIVYLIKIDRHLKKTEKELKDQ